MNDTTLLWSALSFDVVGSTILAVVWLRVTRPGQWILHSVKRTLRTVKRLAGHDGLPRPLRWMFVLMFVPIPGPFDEAVALLALLVMVAFYRPILRSAWEQAA